MSFLRARTCPVLVTSLSMLVLTTQADAIEPYVAEVTATEVNLRSGPSTNYYVVTKLQAGDRVEVMEEDGGWFGIVPPPGCFSLISKHYVDLDGNGGGVVNGKSVRVRAGSNYDNGRYAVQLKLNEGDEVEVLEDGPEGFLKIKPPKGAYAWIHSELTARASEKWVDPDSFKSNSATASPPTTVVSRTPSVDVTNRPTKSDDSMNRMNREDDIVESKTTSTESTGVRPGFGPREKSADTTDRVAVYTWSDESGGKVKRVDSNTGNVGTHSKSTMSDASAPKATSMPDRTKPAAPSQAMPSETQRVAEIQPTENRATTVDSSNAANADSQGHSTSRSAQFSNDSTGQVAIIKWDDSSGAAVSQPSVQSESSQQPEMSRSNRNQAMPSSSQTNMHATGISSATPQSSTGANVMTMQPTTVESESSHTYSGHGDQSVAYVSNTATIEQPQFAMRTEAPPVQTTTVSVIPFTGVDPRAELKLIDDQMMRELDKPLGQRQFGELMAKYRGVMQADVDEASQLYAERRIHQLEVLSFRINAVGQINNLVTEVTETRSTASQQRSTFTTISEQPRIGFAATGELRESMVFSSPVGPRRYRLIDPNKSVPHTLCYVEIPRDSNIDVSQYLGRVVGVRASREFVETGNVDPISVLVASSIEPVSSDTRSSVSTSPMPSSQLMDVRSNVTTPSESGQIAIRPMEPTYNP